MSKPSTSPVGRATVHARPRRLLRLLALTALALPLVASAPAGAGVDTSRLTALVTLTVIDGDTVTNGITTWRRHDDEHDDVLDRMGIVLGPLDRVETVPTLLDRDGSLTLRVVRVELERIEREVELSHGLITIEDPDLRRGVARVVEEGRPGSVVKTELVRLVDGEVESEMTLSRSTLRPPVDRIERVGTREVRVADVWDDLARCESSGRWDIVRVVNERLSYYGGLQFHPRTWNAFRPQGFPDLASEATRTEQIQVAQRVLEAQGWGAWPACSRRLGLR